MCIGIKASARRILEEKESIPQNMMQKHHEINEIKHDFVPYA